ncbi:MAG TPA: hypothetical protein VJC09_00040 [Candidatus Saccharimonadales bacterium]|nr:hypothetical protein [Candidatus Saccharimonadales bacterium]
MASEESGRLIKEAAALYADMPFSDEQMRIAGALLTRAAEVFPAPRDGSDAYVRGTLLPHRHYPFMVREVEVEVNRHVRERFHIGELPTG